MKKQTLKAHKENILWILLAIIAGFATEVYTIVVR